VPDFKDKLRWDAVGYGLKGLSSVLMRTARKDARLKRALNDFDGVYRFENRDGSLYRFLIFRGNGKVAASRKWAGDPDFTLTLRDPRAFGLKTRPENVLEAVIANKVGQAGKMYYLYQFGFVMSLLERYFRSKRGRKKSK
jgi:hypothetical protein